MSNTYRKDRNGKAYKEGLKKKDGGYRCTCHYCVGVDKKELVEKIAKKEMKEEIKTVETGENIDYDILEQDEILEQIMGRV